jgi:hypothetical protein
MTDTPTPGEVSYAAYWPALGAPPPVPWAGLSAVVQAAWEAAAQAVRAWQDTCVYMSRDDFDHLLNCLANQKFLHEMAGSLIWENRKQAAEIQAAIDAAWRKGMDLLSPKEDTP